MQGNPGQGAPMGGPGNRGPPQGNMPPGGMPGNQGPRPAANNNLFGDPLSGQQKPPGQR